MKNLIKIILIITILYNSAYSYNFDEPIENIKILKNYIDNSSYFKNKNIKFENEKFNIYKYHELLKYSFKSENNNIKINFYPYNSSEQITTENLNKLNNLT
jgi:hypothetical protein